MTLSRVVAGRLAAAALCLGLGLPHLVAAQSAPKLSKSQRTTLEAVVAAVDQAQASSAATPATWQTHVLRASDGSHYVALSAVARDIPAPKDVVLLYVRLATRRTAAERTSVPERSAVAEWLKGLRGDPLPMRAGRAMTVPPGELPVGGAASLSGRPGSSSAAAVEASIALRLQDRERERAARERAERDKRRRAELESAAATPAPAMHPFEDFDLQTRLVAGPQGLVVERGLTVGPGDYDVYVAWADSPAAGRSPSVRVLTHRLTLPGASSTEFSLSDVVLAGSVLRSPRSRPWLGRLRNGRPDRA